MTDERLQIILSAMAQSGPVIEENDEGYFELDRYELKFHFVESRQERACAGDPKDSNVEVKYIQKLTGWTFSNDEELIFLSGFQTDLVRAWLNAHLKGIEIGVVE